jgi:hypothetical protein
LEEGLLRWLNSNLVEKVGGNDVRSLLPELSDLGKFFVERSSE